MQSVIPSSVRDLTTVLKEASALQKTIEIAGNNSKRLMGGPTTPADIKVNTGALRRVLTYEPNDLTVSVEAGMPFADLQALLAKNRQMVALDPPFFAKATVGGVVATNSNGPMRRTYGTARDQVIGMKFATLAGKQISSGGMVVKNVAGLDVGKLMIGSFGTLAVLTSVNFRLHPMPEQTQTFVFSFNDVDQLMEKRNSILYSVLRPISLDIISPPAATRLGLRGHVLALRAGGSTKVLARYERELQDGTRMTGAEDTIFWTQIREFSGDFLRRQPNGVVLRISSELSDLAAVLRLVSGACICRAASGISYVYLSSWQGVSALWQAAAENGWSAVVEFAPLETRVSKELWLLGSSKESGEAFAMMKKVKAMFDPEMLLNRSRLYGRI
jgi:glycolate oxidase FAD binding subunit